MAWLIDKAVDLRGLGAAPVELVHAYVGDTSAYTWRVTVTEGGAAKDLTGYTVVLQFLRTADASEIDATGTISGNVATLTIPQVCFAYAGVCGAVMRLVKSATGENTPVCGLTFAIRDLRSDTVVDPGTVVPDLAALLAVVESAHTASDAANEAAAYATGIGETLDVRMDAIEASSADLQDQIDVLVVEGDSSVEAAQARINAAGAAFATLKARLDDADGQRAAIAHQGVAYVETSGSDTTGTVNQIGKPFATVGKALDALPATGGVIRVGVGAFQPVPTSKWKDGVTIIGAKMPRINDAHTALIDGTVIMGDATITDRNYIGLINLGIDNGADVGVNIYGGADANQYNALSVGSLDVDNPMKGLVLKDIVTLNRTPTTAFHSCLIENVTGAYVQRVVAYHGVHGFVFKGFGSTVRDITGIDCDTDAVIIKDSSYDTDCKVNNVDGITIRTELYPCGGLILDSSGDADNTTWLRELNISNILIVGTKFGVKFGSTAATKLSNINMDNLVTDYIEGAVMEFIGVNYEINITNVQGIACRGDGIRFSSATHNVNLLNANLASLVADTTAIKLDGDSNTIRNASLSGFSVNWDFAGSNNKLYDVVLGAYTGDATTARLNGSDTAPTFPTLLNGYTNLNAGSSQAKYYKEGNVVYLEGNIVKSVSSTIVFVLPTGYIPPVNMRFLGISESGYANITITWDGSVSLEVCAGNWFSLDGISFRV